ncbi:hypothetical protein [Methylobacterium nigriterrae]|uniref:hypothetical protein n=1 Tax=Methylobacterium nigriterrae TaxID=3127512 RepID=UPI003013B465
MRCLRDVPSERLMIECAACRRRGSYRLDRLTTRYGEFAELRAFLAQMRERCGRAPCQAHLVVPMRLDLDRPAEPSNRFDLDIWTSGTSIEMKLGQVWNFDVAAAAFDKAVTLWPHSIMTVRLGAQVMRAHNPGEQKARVAQNAIVSRLGLR